MKFTRALTREIEVAGERLAVTLDADGLTVRPVGSRREPHKLTWAAVASAAVSQSTPTAEETGIVLAALRAGAAKPKGEKAPPAQSAPALAPAAMASPADNAPPAPPERLADVLPRLDAWLLRHRPTYYAALERGATPEQLEGLRAALGQPLPDELRTWLGWHNGQKEGIHGAFVEAFDLLGTDGIAATARIAREEGLVEGWNAAWIPLAADGQGNVIALDPTAAGHPLREVWRGIEAHAVSAKSLGDWAQALLADFEANRYVEDPERGELMRVSQG